MSPSTCLCEEDVEGVVSCPSGLVTWHLAIGLGAMFQVVELPASNADLDTILSSMDGDALIQSCYFMAAQGWQRRESKVVASYRATHQQ